MSRGSLGQAEGQNAKKQNGDEMMNDVVTNTVVKNAARSCTLDKIAPLKQRAARLPAAFTRSYFNFALKTPNYTLGRGMIRVGHPQMVEEDNTQK